APINLGLPRGAAIFIYTTSLFLGQSIMCFLAFHRMRGRPIGLGEGLNVGLHRSLPLLGIILFIPVMVGMLQSLYSAVGVGVILLPVWFMAMPACMIEGLGPLRSLGRGRALTKGHRWKMLVLMLLVIAAGLGLLVTMRLVVRTILSFGPPEIIGPIA